VAGSASAPAGNAPLELSVESRPDDAGEARIEEPIGLSWPGREWTLRLRLPGFRHGEPRGDADGERILLRGFAEDSGLTLELTLSPAEPGEGPRELRERTWKRVRRGSAGLPRRGADRRRGDGAVLEYTLREMRGVRVDQRHVHLLLVHDGIAIDVHLSQPQYDAERDAALFESVLESVRVEP